MTSELFKQIQKGLPEEPGIYKYADGDGTLLYVGKAKNIRKRVSSYFTGKQNSRKTAELVRRIEKIDFTIVDSEQDALLLENALIKEFQPRFNIDLKDDKTYPYIVIKHEPFPRVFLTRRMIRDGSEYLGPFASSGKVRELLHFIRQHIQIRTCKLNLSEKQISKGIYKPCLEYQLGNCKAPCAGYQSEEDYQEGLSRLRNLLKGNLTPVLQHYKADMKAYSENLDFEKAEAVRKKIEHLKTYSAKSPVMNPRLGDIDVLGIVDDEEMAFVSFLMVRSGIIIDTHHLEVRKKLDEEPAEILSKAVIHLRESFRSDAPEIVVPIPLTYPDLQVRCIVPAAGDKLKLLELSLKNAEFFKAEYQRRKILKRQAEDPAETLESIREDLHLMDLPTHIECFDNSNFQGSYPVSAMVCFRDGQPSKNDYRHYHIKTVEGIDDFATMREVVTRRYKKLAETGKPFPQLVIIDGGKGQLNAALESIRTLGLEGKMTLVGLAKNEEEVFFAGDRQSLKLPMDGKSMRLIRRIRNEVHRFGISFHRDTRSKAVFKNSLEEIPGIGRQTAAALLQEFRSIKKISALSEAQLSEKIGASKAGMVYRYFHSE